MFLWATIFASFHVVIAIKFFSPESDTPAKVAPNDIARYINVEGGLLWVDIVAATDQDHEFIHDNFKVDRSVLAAIQSGHQLPKLEEYGGYWLLVLRLCKFVQSSLKTGELGVLFGGGWLITVHPPRRTESMLDLDIVQGDYLSHRIVQRPITDETHGANAASGASGLNEAALFLDALLSRAAQEYGVVAEVLEDTEDQLEEAIFTDFSETNAQRRIYVLRRDLIDFRNVVAPLIDVLSALDRVAQEVPALTLPHARSIADQLARLYEFIEQQRELLTGIIDAHLAMVSNQVNKVMKKMTSWGAILIVVAIVVGIYGMNFKHMPELQWRYGYPMAIGSLFLVGLVLYVYFRRKDWL